MADQPHRKQKVQLDRYTILSPIPPFIDVILQNVPINRVEFQKIAELAASYPNDPRLVLMIRKAGDYSAKIPYLMETGETPQTILKALREAAAPQVERLNGLPDAMKATIHTLLSINMVPTGCETYGIPALLEINRIQKEMTDTLHSMMEGRKLAQEFHENNVSALQLLDKEWPNVRKEIAPWPVIQSVPERSQMQIKPVFFKDSLVTAHEVCVIVDPPNASELRSMIPPVLLDPLPEEVEVPHTGSVDWLIRKVGKVGRHFTRALLDIIVQYLQAERIQANRYNYERITYEAQGAFRSFIERNP